MAKKEQIKKNNELVVKDNELIQEKRLDTMNITQMKIMNLIISKFDNSKKLEDIKKEDLTFNLSLKELEEKLGERLEVGRLANYVDDLTTKRYYEIMNNKFLFIPIFSKASYQNGVLEMIFNDEIIKYFLEKKDNFTTYYFDNIARFKSKYSILLYEILKSQKFKKEATFTVMELYKMLQVEKETMKIFKAFNRYILTKTQSEINSTSDIHFEYSMNKKQGTKTIESITFRIYDSETNKNEYRDLRKFIAFIRKNYVNQAIMVVNDKSIGKQKTLTINKDGYLYFLDSFNEKIDKEQAEKIWNVMFNNQKNIMKHTGNLFEQVEQ